MKRVVQPRPSGRGPCDDAASRVPPPPQGGVALRSAQGRLSEVATLGTSGTRARAAGARGGVAGASGLSRAPGSGSAWCVASMGSPPPNGWGAAQRAAPRFRFARSGRPRARDPAAARLGSDPKRARHWGSGRAGSVSSSPLLRWKCRLRRPGVAICPCAVGARHASPAGAPRRRAWNTRDRSPQHGPAAHCRRAREPRDGRPGMARRPGPSAITQIPRSARDDNAAEPDFVSDVRSRKPSFHVKQLLRALPTQYFHQ